MQRFNWLVFIACLLTVAMTTLTIVGVATNNVFILACGVVVEWVAVVMVFVYLNMFDDER